MTDALFLVQDNVEQILGVQRVVRVTIIRLWYKRNNPTIKFTKRLSIHATLLDYPRLAIVTEHHLVLRKDCFAEVNRLLDTSRIIGAVLNKDRLESYPHHTSRLQRRHR